MSSHEHTQQSEGIVNNKRNVEILQLLGHIENTNSYQLLDEGDEAALEAIGTILTHAAAHIHENLDTYIVNNLQKELDILDAFLETEDASSRAQLQHLLNPPQPKEPLCTETKVMLGPKHLKVKNGIFPVVGFSIDNKLITFKEHDNGNIEIHIGKKISDPQIVATAVKKCLEMMKDGKLLVHSSGLIQWKGDAQSDGRTVVALRLSTEGRLEGTYNPKTMIIEWNRIIQNHKKWKRRLRNDGVAPGKRAHNRRKRVSAAS